MDSYFIGDSYEFLPASHELKVKGKSETIKLEPLINDLLLLFVSQPDIVILRSDLIDQLWEGNSDVGEPALTKSLFKLRRLFGDDGKSMFDTVSKQGYRFNSKFNSEKKPARVNRIAIGGMNSRFIIVLVLLLILIVVVASIIDPKLWHKITH